MVQKNDKGMTAHEKLVRYATAAFGKNAYVEKLPGKPYEAGTLDISSWPPKKQKKFEHSDWRTLRRKLREEIKDPKVVAKLQQETEGEYSDEAVTK